MTDRSRVGKWHPRSGEGGRGRKNITWESIQST